MVFSSPAFLFAFLPCVLALFFGLPRRVRTPMLFGASLVFYAWGETLFVLYLIASVAVNYALGLALERAATPRRRRLVVAAAVAGNVGALAWFKYAGFLSSNAVSLATVVGLPVPPLLATHLPIGISFITFEAVSYIVDVYRGTLRAQRNPIHVGFFVSFFPHLIAGPILRFANVQGPLSGPTVTLAGFESGVRRFILGLAKKVLVANTVARVVDDVFALPGTGLSTGAAWLGVLCYAVQIYFDFSGYTDMAIGLGRMFGFELPENFRLPYASTSIRDFWRRWHITLSRWFRDYLYIPLGGNRVSRRRQYLNLFAVFLLCGLWHGARWTFVAWGAFHGCFLVFERGHFGRWLASAWRPLQHAYAMAVVLVGWALFRSESMTQAFSILGAMAGYSLAPPWRRNEWVSRLDRELVLTLLVAIPLATLPLGAWAAELRARLARRRWAGLACDLAAATATITLFAASAAYLASGTYNPFIYYRF
jgi:alginate O-acetyltransferase complex protein AlgI